MAMQQFVRNHYSQSLPHAHVRTALPTVSHRWIEEPAKQHAEQFRLRARVRLGIANINAYRQPRGANSRRNCAHCGTLETLAHMFAGCDRFRSHYRRRHDDSAEVTLADLATALGAVQNTTTGGVNPGLLINSSCEISPKTTGKSHPKRHKTAIFACGAGGLIHRQILFSALVSG